MQIDDTQYVSNNWTDEEGNHQGGQAYGPGFAIAWQRGPIENHDQENQNGALLMTVLRAAADQLIYFQNSKFKCEENEKALQNLEKCIECLEQRLSRRKQENKLGTLKV